MRCPACPAWPLSGRGILMALAGMILAGLAIPTASAQQIGAEGAGTPTALLYRLEGTADEMADGEVTDTLAAGDRLARGTTIDLHADSRAELYLADGTRVYLGGQARLRLGPIFFAPEVGQGNVTLRLLNGPAVIEVGGIRRIPGEPFVLRSMDAEVRPAGTRFWVARQQARLDVALIDGDAVEVINAGSGARLAEPRDAVRIAGRSGQPEALSLADARWEAAQALTNW